MSSGRLTQPLFVGRFEETSPRILKSKIMIPEQSGNRVFATNCAALSTVSMRTERWKAMDLDKGVLSRVLEESRTG